MKIDGVIKKGVLCCMRYQLYIKVDHLVRLNLRLT